MYKFSKLIGYGLTLCECEPAFGIEFVLQTYGDDDVVFESQVLKVCPRDSEVEGGGHRVYSSEGHDGTRPTSCQLEASGVTSGAGGLEYQSNCLSFQYQNYTVLTLG